MRQEYLIFAALIILLLAAFFLFRRFRKRIRSGRYAPPKGRTLRVSLESGDYGRMAEILLLGLGGESNVSSAEAGERRLRIGIRDYDRVDQEKLESSGVIGVLRPSKNSVQIIAGDAAEELLSSLLSLLEREREGNRREEGEEKGGGNVEKL